MNCPKCGNKTTHIKGEGWYCRKCGLVRIERQSKGHK